MTEVVEMDEYEIKLEDSLQELNRCQNEHKTASCMDCEKILGCQVRKTYVEAVYNSMSKGQAGGFEF